MGPKPGSQHSHWQRCRVLECRGIRGSAEGVGGALGVASGLGAQPHWVPALPLAGVGASGCRGVRGLHGISGGIGSGRWTGSLTTLGTSPGSQHSHWQGCRCIRGLAGVNGALGGVKWTGSLTTLGPRHSYWQGCRGHQRV